MPVNVNGWLATTPDGTVGEIPGRAAVVKLTEPETTPSLTVMT